MSQLLEEINDPGARGFGVEVDPSKVFCLRGSRSQIGRTEYQADVLTESWTHIVQILEEGRVCFSRRW